MWLELPITKYWIRREQGALWVFIECWSNWTYILFANIKRHKSGQVQQLKAQGRGNSRQRLGWQNIRASQQVVRAHWQINRQNDWSQCKNHAQVRIERAPINRSSRPLGYEQAKEAWAKVIVFWRLSHFWCDGSKDRTIGFRRRKSTGNCSKIPG